MLKPPPLFPTAGSVHLVLIYVWTLSCGGAPLPACGVGPAVPVSAYSHPSKHSSSSGGWPAGGHGRNPTLLRRWCGLKVCTLPQGGMVAPVEGGERSLQTTPWPPLDLVPAEQAASRPAWKGVSR